MLNMQKKLERICLRYVNYQPEYREIAANSVQKTFLKALEEYGKLKDASYIEPWLYQTCMHRFTTALKTYRRRMKETFVSAVVHLDEKTLHMHVTFVPLTEDNRLSAKEIIGNKAKLSQWQSDYWEHMVSKYSDLERGESADKTDRKHVPPRVLKEMTHLAKQSRKIEPVMDDANVFNAKGKLQEVEALLERFIPSVERSRPSSTNTKSPLRTQPPKTLP